MKTSYRQSWFWYWVFTGKLHPDHYRATLRGENTDPGFVGPVILGTILAVLIVLPFVIGALVR